MSEVVVSSKEEESVNGGTGSSSNNNNGHGLYYGDDSTKVLSSSVSTTTTSPLSSSSLMGLFAPVPFPQQLQAVRSLEEEDRAVSVTTITTTSTTTTTTPPGTPSLYGGYSNDGNDNRQRGNNNNNNNNSSNARGRSSSFSFHNNDGEQTPLLKNKSCAKVMMNSSLFFPEERTPKTKITAITNAASCSNNGAMPQLLPSIFESPVNFGDGSNSTPWTRGNAGAAGGTYSSRATASSTHPPKFSPSSSSSSSSSPPSQPQPSRLRYYWSQFKDTFHLVVTEATKSTTWIGAFMFLLYHVVFCLTMGSTISRKHSTRSMVGLMTKTTAMGVLFSAPIFWYSLADDIPALYPTVDLFTAPFFASMAVIVDEGIYEDQIQDDDDLVFLTTFTFLASMSLALSGVLLSLASVFKLADLASFLPTSVISGFFAAVGVLLWTLAVKVDTSGLTVQQIVTSGDWIVIQQALKHHLPSVITASVMKVLGSKHPFGVVGGVLATILAFYGTMFFSGISMEEMVERGWFWSKEDIVYTHLDTSNSSMADTENNIMVAAFFRPPFPMGWIRTSFYAGNIHWASVTQALPTVVAFAALYLIRCSVHAAALKKNVPMMQRKVQTVTPLVSIATTLTQSIRAIATSPRRMSRPSPLRAANRRFSENVDIEQMASSREFCKTQLTGTVIQETFESPPNSKHTMKEMLFQYGIAQYIVALVGSFAVLPSVAASSTLYSLNADGVSPQLGSVFLLAVFHLTNFELVRFIPKAAFSSMLILAFINMFQAWLVDSYFKTKEKLEWLVVPLIVVLAFAMDLLSAVFLGISLSTFFFAASFFRSGVVKYLATGTTIRSTCERPFDAGMWLDQNGDLIRVLFLQNYLFFGNASSILNYISSIFEVVTEDTGVDDRWHPIPKVVILDFQLVSGIDGSAVDVLADILSVCKSHKCKLFLSGVSPRVRTTMALRGLKPEGTQDRSARVLRFFYDFDDAVGKAEDLLLEEQFFEEFLSRPKRVGDTGFVYALRVIDEQHGTSFGDELAGLEAFTEVVELEPGEVLYDQQNLERGLFFIEEGTLKIDRAADVTLTRCGSTNSLTSLAADVWARGTIGRQHASTKTLSKGPSATQTFRVARIGPGWVIGMIEALSGLVNPGSTVAVDACRLHYISFKSLEEIEQHHPKLSLKLYKLLSLLMAKRQETTVSHLAMIHAIIGSLALANNPMSRKEAPSLRSRKQQNGQRS